MGNPLLQGEAPCIKWEQVLIIWIKTQLLSEATYNFNMQFQLDLPPGLSLVRLQLIPLFYSIHWEILQVDVGLAEEVVSSPQVLQITGASRQAGVKEGRNGH